MTRAWTRSCAACSVRKGLIFLMLWSANLQDRAVFTMCSLKVSWSSRVTRITFVLWIGNETLRASRFGNASCVTDVWSPYRITPIHWLMVRRRPWRTHVVSLYWWSRHLLLRFLCRKEPCRQHEEFGSERSASFPIKRTRVTRVTETFSIIGSLTLREALYALGTIDQTRQAKNAAYLVQ